MTIQSLIAADINNSGRSSLVSPSFIYGASGTSQFLPKACSFLGKLESHVELLESFDKPVRRSSDSC